MLSKADCLSFRVACSQRHHPSDPVDRGPTTQRRSSSRSPPSWCSHPLLLAPSQNGPSSPRMGSRTRCDLGPSYESRPFRGSGAPHAPCLPQPASPTPGARPISSPVLALGCFSRRAGLRRDGRTVRLLGARLPTRARARQGRGNLRLRRRGCSRARCSCAVGALDEPHPVRKPDLASSRPRRIWRVVSDVSPVPTGVCATGPAVGHPGKRTCSDFPAFEDATACESRAGPEGITARRA
jgi:hypothetical protein